MRVFSKQETIKLVNSHGRSRYMGIIKSANSLKVGQSIGIEIGVDKDDSGNVIKYSGSIESIKSLIKTLRLNLRAFIRKEIGSGENGNVASFIIIEKKSGLKEDIYPITPNRVKKLLKAP